MAGRGVGRRGVGRRGVGKGRAGYRWVLRRVIGCSRGVGKRGVHCCREIGRIGVMIFSFMLPFNRQLKLGNVT